jgi:hypothetical protein
MTWSFVRPGDAIGSAPAADAAPWLADDFLARYVCWREESDSVQAAYEHWRGGRRPDRALAFAAYRAALDREERAALTFGELVERLRGGRT